MNPDKDSGSFDGNGYGTGIGTIEDSKCGHMYTDFTSGGGDDLYRGCGYGHGSGNKDGSGYICGSGNRDSSGSSDNYRPSFEIN